MRIGFLLFDGLEELGLLGPWELIGVWASLDDWPSERLLIGASTEPIVCAKSLRLTPDLTMTEAGALDMLVVPGGRGSRRVAQDARYLDFVTRQAEHGDILSVCTGALVLAAAGLLDGRTATTHHASLPCANGRPSMYRKRAITVAGLSGHPPVFQPAWI